MPASAVPVVVGTAVAAAEGQVIWWRAAAALVVAVAIQVGTNYANDYSDGVRGTDARRVGPVRLVASGLAPAAAVRRAAIISFGVAALAGLALAAAAGWWLLLVGAASVAAGWLYTGGPRPYGYLGLGELFVFLFFGLVATCGTVYVELLRITPLAVWFGCAFGFLASAILVLNNLRDLDTDAAAGKRTLATRLGRAGTRYMLLVLVCAAFTVPIVVFLSHMASWTVMLVHFSIPIAAAPVRSAFASTSPPVLVSALKRMAAAELAFALLLTAGLLL